jgi:hypothetical protein
MMVHSDTWDRHLHHIFRYLSAIKAAGLTLGLQKCEFAKPEIKLIGHIIGSGRRCADPDKITAIQQLKEPETKLQVRQILGLFSFFRDCNIRNLALIAKPSTDLTSKRVSEAAVLNLWVATPLGVE